VFQYPHFNPVAFSIGPLHVRWYGIMYLASFLLVWLGLRARSKLPWSKVRAQHVDDIVFYGALGAIVGGRIGYMFVYGLQELLSDPLSIFTVWKGGMSFHGGLSGVLIAMYLYGRRVGLRFFEITDAIAPWCAGGIFLVRMGNFINGELWGKPTSPDAWWGVVFDGVPRHPSQLYEGFLEGIVVCVVLWLYTRKPRPLMATSGFFLLLYGVFRTLVEFVRVPDEQLGYLAFGWVTMGMLLSLPMIVAGATMVVLAYRRNADAAQAGTPPSAPPTQRAMPKKAG
jgi:phosphatidylglycerol:prolipoprotein diacylglycerol transferase